MVKKTPQHKRRFNGTMVAAKLQEEIDAIRERLTENGPRCREKDLRPGKTVPCALAGLSGPKPTKRPRRWEPRYHYVTAESQTHRAKDTRFNR